MGNHMTIKGTDGKVEKVSLKEYEEREKNKNHVRELAEKIFIGKMSLDSENSETKTEVEYRAKDSIEAAQIFLKVVKETL